MKNLMILVSGMPGVGKTSFAKWLSSEMHIPLVCYDSVMEKLLEITEDFESDVRNDIRRRFSLEVLWFFCEEIMKSSSSLIVEYFFTEQMKEATIDGLIEKYKYQTINVHLDTSTDIAYSRFSERNQKNMVVKNLRPKEISFEQFNMGVQNNKNFKYGSNIIYVDTTDLTTLSYERIATEVLNKASEIVI